MFLSIFVWGVVVRGGVPMFCQPRGVDVGIPGWLSGALRPAGGVRRPFRGPVQATRTGSRVEDAVFEHAVDHVASAARGR